MSSVTFKKKSKGQHKKFFRMGKSIKRQNTPYVTPSWKIKIPEHDVVYQGSLLEDILNEKRMILMKSPTVVHFLKKMQKNQENHIKYDCSTPVSSLENPNCTEENNRSSNLYESNIDDAILETSSGLDRLNVAYTPTLDNDNKSTVLWSKDNSAFSIILAPD